MKQHKTLDIIRLKELEHRRDTLAFRRYQFDKTHTDNGIMRDNTSCKFLGFSLSSTTRSGLLWGGAILTFGLGGYGIYKSIKTKNSIKLINARTDAGLALYVGKKKADKEYGKSSETEEDETFRIESEFQPEEPKDFNEVVNNGLMYGGLKPIQSQYVNEGDLIFFYGSDGSGKSAAVAQLAISFAMGKPSGMFPGETTNEPIPVFWIDSELNERNHAERYGKILTLLPNNIQRVTGKSYRDFDDCVVDIRKNAWKRTTGCIVIIDNPTVSLNMTSGTKAQQFMMNLRKLQEEYYSEFQASLTMLVVGHMDKENKKFYGSQQLRNIVTMSYELRISDSDHDKRILRVTKDRNGDKIGQTLTLRMTDSNNWLHMEFVSLSDPRHQPDKDSTDGRKDKGLSNDEIREIREAYQMGAKPKDLAKEYKVSVRTIYRKLEGLPKQEAHAIDDSSENDEPDDIEDLSD